MQSQAHSLTRVQCRSRVSDPARGSIPATVVTLIAFGDINAAIRRAIATHRRPVRTWIGRICHGRSEQGACPCAEKRASRVSTNRLSKQRTGSSAQNGTRRGALLLRSSIGAASQGRSNGNHDNSDIKKLHGCRLYDIGIDENAFIHDANDESILTAKAVIRLPRY